MYFKPKIVACPGEQHMVINPITVNEQLVTCRRTIVEGNNFCSQGHIWVVNLMAFINMLTLASGPEHVTQHKLSIQHNRRIFFLRRRSNDTLENTDNEWAKKGSTYTCKVAAISAI
jgi:hypothetical protein